MATTGEALLHDGRQSAAAIKQLVQAQDLFSDGLTLHRARIKRKYRELLCEHLPLAHEHATERHLWKYGFHVIIEQYRSITRKVSSGKDLFLLHPLLLSFFFFPLTIFCCIVHCLQHGADTSSALQQQFQEFLFEAQG